MQLAAGFVVHLSHGDDLAGLEVCEVCGNFTERINHRKTVTGSLLNCDLANSFRSAARLLVRRRIGTRRGRKSNYWNRELAGVIIMSLIIADPTCCWSRFEILRSIYTIHI